MATIRRRDSTSKTGRAQVRKFEVRAYAPDGTRVTKSFATLAEARAWGAEVERSKSTGSFIDPRRQHRTLREVAEEWQTSNVVEPATKKKNRSLLNSHVLPFTGDVLLTNVDERTFLNFVTFMIDKKCAAGTTRSAVNVLTAVMNYAVRVKYLARSPKPPRLRLPRGQRKPVFLSHEEVSRLVDAHPERYQALVYLLAYSGLRWSEAVGLQRRHLNLLRRQVTVDRTFRAGEEGPTKTDGSRRTIGLSKDTASMLSAHLTKFQHDADPRAFVFVGPQDGALDGNTFRRRVWTDAVKEARLTDVAPTPHDLRHTHVAHLINQGWHAKAIQMRLGHTSVKTTLDTYGHLFPDSDSKVLDRLDGAARKGRKKAQERNRSELDEQTG